MGTALSNVYSKSGANVCLAQGLMGHRNLRTTMIYTHTVKSVTIKEAKSPLDL
jgi:site-specific recombinase XerD